MKRFFWGLVGVLGELSITAGIFLGLFLGWQLWWTDVVAEQEQDQIISTLHEDWGEPPKEEGKKRYDDPPVPEKPQQYQVWGTIYIPAFDRPVVPLAEDVSLKEVLNVKGAGHYPETALPGEIGNFSVAGHRTTYGKPFNEIAKLKPGDPIVVETKDAYYVYTVQKDEIIYPNEVRVIAPVINEIGAEPTERWMTLTACHPLYSARQRYVVHAKFDYWMKRSDGKPDVLKNVHN